MSFQDQQKPVPFFASIRTRLILGIGLILTLSLLTAVIGYLSLQSLQAGIQTTMDKANHVRELSLEAENAFLAARQSEARFLTTWRAIGFETASEMHVVAVQNNLAGARTKLDELDDLAALASDVSFARIADETDKLHPLLDEYENAFLATVNYIEERSQVAGLESELQIELDDIKQAVIPLGIVELNALILRMRTAQDSYLSTGQQQYVDNMRSLVNQFSTQVETSGTGGAIDTSTQKSLNLQVQNYHATFSELVTLDQEIAVNSTIFREVTTDINQLTRGLAEEGEEGLARARDNLQTDARQTTLALIGTTVVALALGTGVALLLTRRIIRPLNQLGQAAQRIGQGDLSQTVHIGTGDEFATLAKVFNTMAAQLHGLIGSLEQHVAERTRALETSMEVSRRLSTILDQQELVAAVVEQVRSAFDYYYAHIYLVDKASGYPLTGSGQALVMVGGTGEAGRTMLARGHTIPAGKGLVGRAAATNSIVLIPDVSQDAGWLPNPLLPETKAEVAVPIAIGERVLGVLDVQHDVAGGLGQAEADLIQAIANQVAIALQNTRTFADTQQRAEHEALIGQITRQIQSTTTVESTLQTAARELGRALGAQRASVQLEPQAQ